MQTEDELRLVLLGQIVRTKRKSIGLNQQALATRMGYKGVLTVSNIERGKYQIELHVLYALSKALNVKPSSLLDEVDSIVKLLK